MKVLVLVLVLEHEVLVLVLNIWSWSRSWRKSIAVFQDFCCNSRRQWARHTMAFCETTKTFCHWEAIVWENFLRSMHISLSWEGI